MSPPRELPCAPRSSQAAAATALTGMALRAVGCAVASVDPTIGGVVAEPVRVRRLTDQEGQKLQQIVRRGSTSSVRFRRAMMMLASAGGNRVPVIAQLVQADEDTVRDVIHRFNEIGLAALDPRWAGGRSRLLSPDDKDFVVQTATTRPTKLGQPFTRWSIRKLAAYLRTVHGRVIRIGREALRCLLARRGISFQRTMTWKESPGLGSRWSPRAAPRDLPPHSRRPLLPRLLLNRRRHPLGRQPPQEGRREHPGRTPVNPRGPPGRRPDLRDHGQPVRPQGPTDPALGEEAPRRAVLHTDLRPGPTRSRATSDPCGSSRSRTPTTATTPSRPVPCTPTCAGATPTPATPTSSAPNAANAPASAARRASAGADAHSPRQPERTAVPSRRTRSPKSPPGR